MTASEIIERTNRLFPDTQQFPVKLQRLKELDGRIYQEFLSAFTEGEKNKPETEYSQGTVLLLPDEYSEVYMRYLCLQQDIENGDTARYINSASLFNAAYLSFMSSYTRKHTVKPVSIKY